jgi:hypothetical protein
VRVLRRPRRTKTTIIIIISIIVITIIFFSCISKGSVTPTNRGSATQRSLPSRRPPPQPFYFTASESSQPNLSFYVVLKLINGRLG